MSLEYPEQDLYLDSFSSRDFSNIQKIEYFFNADTTSTVTVGVEVFPDLTEDLKNNNSIVPIGDNFNIDSTGSTVVITSGRCIISGVIIETTESVTMDLNSSSNYFFSNSPPSTDQYLFIAIYYGGSNAEIGVISEETDYDNNRDNLCTIGILDVSCTGGIITSVDSIYATHPDNLNYGREIPPRFLDCGEIT